MMGNISKKEIELHEKISKWLIRGDIEGEPAKLKEDAPEEIKKAYKEWLSI